MDGLVSRTPRNPTDRTTRATRAYIILYRNPTGTSQPPRYKCSELEIIRFSRYANPRAKVDDVPRVSRVSCHVRGSAKRSLVGTQFFSRVHVKPEYYWYHTARAGKTASGIETRLGHSQRRVLASVRKKP